jgi:hypothetical protein
VRLAERDGDIYLDLANREWQAVKITATGWQVVSDSPVKFIRPRGMLPLPIPQHGGRLVELRDFVNVATEEDFLLLVACITAYLRPRGPYPLLAIYGEQGSAKSTATRVVRELIDPNVAPLRSEPKELRDVAISASNSWCIAFENLSSIPVWLSDCLCRLSTGGGFATRELFTDGEEKLFDAQRPVVINGIVEVVTRPDLADRAVAITLPSIPDEKRLPESEFWPRFYAARPRMLGALLDAVSMAMRNLSTTRLDRLPGMADFALWATAAEPAFGVRSGDFMAAYAGNRSGLNETALDSCPIAPFLMILMDNNGGHWEGRAGELLEALNCLATDEAKREKGWPGGANILSGVLRRIAPNLRRVGMEVILDNRNARRRKIIIRIVEPTSVTTVTERHSAAKSPDESGWAAHRHSIATESSPSSPAEEPKTGKEPRKTGGIGTSDDGDDLNPQSSGGDESDQYTTE